MRSTWLCLWLLGILCRLYHVVLHAQPKITLCTKLLTYPQRPHIPNSFAFVLGWFLGMAGGGTATGFGVWGAGESSVTSWCVSASSNSWSSCFPPSPFATREEKRGKGNITQHQAGLCLNRKNKGSVEQKICFHDEHSPEGIRNEQKAKRFTPTWGPSALSRSNRSLTALSSWALLQNPFL